MEEESKSDNIAEVLYKNREEGNFDNPNFQKKLKYIRIQTDKVFKELESKIFNNVKDENKAKEILNLFGKYKDQYNDEVNLYNKMFYTTGMSDIINLLRSFYR